MDNKAQYERVITAEIVIGTTRLIHYATGLSHLQGFESTHGRF
jgi:hypothetical protein